jgi:RND family efflux transporter MFP subunit
MIAPRLLVLLLLLTSCAEKEQPAEPIRPVKAIQVTSSVSASEQIAFPGTLRALKRADLSFRVDGTVILRDIYVGYQAKKDEILIKLDPREYEVSLRKAQGKVESIVAQLNFAERDHERMQNIYKKDPGAISVSLIDRKKETVNQLKAELQVAKSEVDKASDDLSYTLLKAPFDGIISAIYVENYEQVRAKQPALRLLDSDEREMEINIPERHIGLFIKDASHITFTVKLDAFPDEQFNASVKEMGTETSSSTQTYPVTLSIKDIPPGISLLAGMSGIAIFKDPYTQASKRLIKLPKSAISTDANGPFVWTVDPQSEKVKKVTVKLENGTTGDFVMVKSGLNVGDWVVVAGTSFLSEGQKVKLTQDQPSS